MLAECTGSPPCATAAERANSSTTCLTKAPGNVQAEASVPIKVRDRAQTEEALLGLKGQGQVRVQPRRAGRAVGGLERKRAEKALSAVEAGAADAPSQDLGRGEGRWEEELYGGHHRCGGQRRGDGNSEVGIKSDAEQ